jgi:hypothetical protein
MILFNAMIGKAENAQSGRLAVCGFLSRNIQHSGSENVDLPGFLEIRSLELRKRDLQLNRPACDNFGFDLTKLFTSTDGLLFCDT